MGRNEKCTFGTRMPIDINMLNEIIGREVKHFRNYKIYRPNFGSVPVTTKFYAAHDQLKQESEEQEATMKTYTEKVSQARLKGPHSKCSAPATENQVYGWYTDPLLRIDRNDKRFYHPRIESTNTKIETNILMSNPRKNK
ncbi:unnamed protein product [Leptidea sinapis]|uniref:Protein FAM183A n=1 Tax=Leptidea sinapis TaxID=189913 RepID=A0A5E4PML5_9NEOP|nr:unnamed protein product [Leptidea sinapis]